MNYKVGQVLYLLLNKESRVFPVQVVEVVLRRTLDGEQTSYSVKMPTRDKDIVDLDKIDANVFLTPADLEGFMNDNAQKTVALLVQQAQTLANNTFHETIEEPAPAPEPTLVSNDNTSETPQPVEMKHNQVATIDLGDGTKARINLDNIGDV